MKACPVLYPEGPGGRQVCTRGAAGVREYRKRVEIMFERQMGRCALCLKPMRLELATFDHANGRGLSGAWRDDRVEVNGVWQNAAVCWPCNSAKGSRRIPYLIQQHVESHEYFEDVF